MADDARVALDQRKALFHRQEQLGRRQQGPRWVDALLVVAVAHVSPELRGAVLDARQAEQLGVTREVVEQGAQFLEEQRYVIFDARRYHAIAQVLVNGAAPMVHLETLAEAGAEAGERALVQRKFTGRQQVNVLHP